MGNSYPTKDELKPFIGKTRKEVETQFPNYIIYDEKNDAEIQYYSPTITINTDENKLIKWINFNPNGN
jgi:hypothetical protein